MPGLGVNSGRFFGQNQLALPNLDVDVVADEEVGLFQPMAFEKDERNLGTRLVSDPIGAEAVVVTGSNLELAAFHTDSLCNSHVATKVEVGRVKTARGTASAIPCEQVFYLLSHPTIDPEFRARRNRKLAGCGFARLVEFSRSVGDFTLARVCVARKKTRCLAMQFIA
jgi:hypothetical protein